MLAPCAMTRHTTVLLVWDMQGSIASMRQQAGRAGRREQDSMAIYVAFDGPLDQHFMTHPQDLLGKPIENAQACVLCTAVVPRGAVPLQIVEVWRFRVVSSSGWRFESRVRHCSYEIHPYICSWIRITRRSCSSMSCALPPSSRSR